LFIFLEAPRDLFTSPPNVDRTEHWNIYKMSAFRRKCVWPVVSLLCRFCLCFVFVSGVWTRPNTSATISFRNLVPGVGFITYLMASIWSL
jgi:hypothetical protein